MTVLWALVVVVNKRALALVRPVAVNFWVRGACIVSLLAIAAPLRATGAWPHAFGIDRGAAGWISLSALVTWLVGFNAYYVALRRGRVSVVAPLTSTDPVWTAVFAWLLTGAAIGLPTVAGLGLATAGIVLVSRWMEPDEATASTGPATALAVVPVAVLAAVAWGLGPVFVDLALRSYGTSTVAMMLLSQAVGMALLGLYLALRREPLTTRPLDPAERRRAARLLAAAGILEALVTVLFYFCIETLGPVLTMLVMATTPLFTMALGAGLLRERVGARLLAAALVTMSGVALAVLDGAL
jgi:drug/metabolite transporter (DMT)-like permease